MKADAYNAREYAVGRVTPRHLTELARLWQRERGLAVDGMLGPKTRASLDSTNRLTDWDVTPRDEDIGAGEPDDQNPTTQLPFSGPLRRIPRTRQEIYEVFGNPGVGKVDKRWRKANIVTVRNLPLVPSKWHFQVHRLAEPYVREGLRRAASASPYVCERAASFVYRHVRHDAGNPLSLHSWGIAVDFDPPRNRAQNYKRGTAPEPWGDEWMATWPSGVDEGFVAAMESVGFTWGGVWGRRGLPFRERARSVSFVDPMHFELRTR